MDGQLPDPSTRVSSDEPYEDAHETKIQGKFQTPSIPDPEPPLRLTHDDYEEEDFVGEIVDESSTLEEDALLDDVDLVDAGDVGGQAVDEALGDEPWESAPENASEMASDDAGDLIEDNPEVSSSGLRQIGASTEDTSDVIDLRDGDADADEPLQMSFDSMFDDTAVKPRPIEHMPVDEDDAGDVEMDVDPVIDAADEPEVNVEPQLVVAEVPSRNKTSKSSHDHQEPIIDGDDEIASCEIQLEPALEAAYGPQPMAGFDPTVYLILETEPFCTEDSITSETDQVEAKPEEPANESQPTTLSWSATLQSPSGQKVLNPTPLGLALAAAERREEQLSHVVETADVTEPTEQAATHATAETRQGGFEPDWQWRLRGRRQLAPLVLGCRITAALSTGIGLTVGIGFVMSGLYGAAAIYGLAGLGLAIVSWTVATMADLMREMCQS